jgi:hypothetical protein
MTPLLIFHVGISLVGILSGLVVLWGFLEFRRLEVLTLVFLVTTILTSATGFPLPPFGLDPPRIVGIVSLVALTLAVIARYGLGMVGIWRAIFVVTSVIALYLNVFVLIVQAFAKAPSLHALAPNGNEPPFAIAQGVVLLLFIAMGYLSVRRFRPTSG